MKGLLRATNWIDSTPVLLFSFTICIFGVLIGSWVIVMSWLEGKETWAMFPFIALWSWGAFSTMRTVKQKKEARRVEIQRLHSVVCEVLHAGSALEASVLVARTRLGANGHTRYRNLPAHGVSAEFDVGSNVIKVFATDGRVTGFEIT
jgi:hypothetical protein